MESLSTFSSIPQLLAIQAAARSRATALVGAEESTVTYGEMETLTRTWASGLIQEGLQGPGRVAIVLPNGPAMAAAFLAVSRFATAAPLNPGLKQGEFAFYLRDLEVQGVLVAEDDPTECSEAARDLGIPRFLVRTGSLELLPPANSPVPLSKGMGLEGEAQPEDVALVLHTSGTTARPKIVPLTHENLCRSAANVAGTLRLEADDRCLNVMPLFHIHGLVAALLGSLHAGSSVVCTPGYSGPHFFDWMERFDPTWYTAVPTMHQGILARAGAREREMARRGRLRLIRSSSASLAPKVLRDLENAFGVPVVEAYGMTEAAHQMTSNPLPPGERKAGSVGLPAGPEVAIADGSGGILDQAEVGEVVIRGANVTRGYHGLEDQTSYFSREGWFRTGDQGFLDADGYLFLTGRLKEIINRGGETIAPREIDEALLELPEVKQGVAFSVPDQALGEEVAAAVVLEDGIIADEGDLQRALTARLSWARMPKRILIVDQLPKGPTGKLQRIGLAERLGLQSVRRSEGAGSRGEAGSSDREGEGAGSARDTLDTLARLWKEVLRVEEVGMDQGFVEAGGDSVTATALVVRVEEVFGVQVPLLAFFDAATIPRQAALVQELLAGS